MTKRLMLMFAATVISYVAVIGSVTCAGSAHADDELLGYTDGGAAPVVDTIAGGGSGQGRLNWTMTVRCENDPARYKMTQDAGTCTATSTDLKLDADRTFDLPVNQSQGARSGGPIKRYVCFALDDGGVPNCKIYKQPN